MRIFPFYIRRSFTFFSREEDYDANNNGWAGVIIAATTTPLGAVNVCIIYEQNVIDGRVLANSLISGIYENRFSCRELFKTWNARRTGINFIIGNTLLFSVPVIENRPQDEAEELCIETSNVIYYLLTHGTMPDSYREDQPTELINSVRPRRSSSAQSAIENMAKVDNEILEDAFTCNMLIDRIKNCDTICSGDEKIKIIVREGNKEMMITNTIFNDNILVIDVDNVKEKELDDNELLDIYTSGSLLSQVGRIFNANSFAHSTDWENVPLTASNIVTSGSSHVF